MLKVKEVFYSIQGEGPFSGRPAVFVRLAGCNLTCSFCDTDHSEGTLMTFEELSEKVRQLADNHTRLVVLTGGEPLLQNLGPLVLHFRQMGLVTQIETNGTQRPDWLRSVTDARGPVVVVSPKTSLDKVLLLDRADAIKLVVKAGQEIPVSELRTLNTMQARHPLIYLSPMDEKSDKKNAANTAYVTQQCLKHGFYLNLQIHKIVNIP